MKERVRVEVRQGVLDITVKLTVTDCASCAVIFAVPDRLIAERREDGQAFYCPNGHSLTFNGEIHKLREQIRSAEARARNAEGDATWYRDRMATAERSRAAIKGQVTKLRKRVVAGACPFGCRRHFANLERHVASQHPDQQLEAEREE